MKTANRRIVNNDDRTLHIAPGSKRKTNRAQAERAPSLLRRPSRRHFTARIVVIAAGIAVAVAIALSLPVAPVTQAQNLGSPSFANPNEIRYNASNNRLRGVIELFSGKFQIPNVGTESLRQFRGWDPSQPAPAPKTEIGPGPTLRARLGDRVELSFLNKIDDSQFPYSFDTNSEPGLSSFGCDKSGTVDPKTGMIMPYPGDDKFPNCFHGSSTANIHFHGTHASPDGLGDNVLVQVMPQPKQTDWTPTFNQMFNSGKIPQKWNDLPLGYRVKQMLLVRAHDVAAAAGAKKNNLPAPEPLWPDNDQRIKDGRWPQFIMGAFPNFFEIPDYDTGKYKAGQAPGTHWYHAHKHGSTSLHILNGLAGAVVIESNRDGGYDHFIRQYYGWGDSYGDHEKIFVFQQFDPTQNLERTGPGGKGIKQVLVNGKLTPTVNMRPGEVQLWRLVNATEGNIPAGNIGNDFFQTSGFNYKQTAQDGVQFSPENYKDQPFLRKDDSAVPGGLVLAGGNRSDILVQAPTKTGVTPFVSNGKTLFFVNVTGQPVAWSGKSPFPTTWAVMPKFLNDLPQPPAADRTNTLRFQWEDGRTGAGRSKTTGLPPRFMINDKQFEQTGPVIDQCMPLNGLQEWVLENYTTVAHPFHIHINPFQVTRIDTPTAVGKYSIYEPKDNFVWQDVVAIPAAKFSADGKQVTPGKVRIRHTFLDFTGTYVLHCHILAHEDRGMMQLVRVVPEGQYPNGCQDSIPIHH